MLQLERALVQGMYQAIRVVWLGTGVVKQSLEVFACGVVGVICCQNLLGDAVAYHDGMHD